MMSSSSSFLSKRFLLFLVWFLSSCCTFLSNAFLAPRLRLRPSSVVSSSCFHHHARFLTKLQHSSQEEEEEEDEDDDEDDDDPPEVNVANFQPPKLDINFGLNRGRSSPSQRKAMGTSGKSTTKVFVCTNCGGESVQWMGRCPTCRNWNTLQEMAVRRAPNHAPKPMFAAASTNSWLDGVGDDYSDQSSRRPISISKVDLQNEKQRLVIPEDEEWNTVLGGGFLKGSLILLGGDPGVGKSTLALQVAAHVAKQSTPSVGIGMGSNTNDSTTPTTTMMGPVWYVSGEETLTQIAIRAQRLETVSPQLFLLAETNLNAVAEQVVQLLHHPVVQNDEQPPLELPPSLIVIDSIQTMMCEAGGTSSSGGVVQLRECMALLLRLAKSTKIPIVAIGHVTKSGDVAGPRMVEHMVDAVLYLEPGNQQQRWLRAAKNRFGSCQNVGLYEFKSGKLVPTPPDSDAFAASSSSFDDLEGCAMSISLEGPYRAIISEVQALVTTSSSFVGKKTVDGGFSYARLQLLLGVLQKHCSVFIGKSRDVYLNVVSGASSSNKQTATGLDLAVAVALTSSLVSIPVRGDTVFLAQVGLLGELRPLSSMEPRLLQAQRMGFSRIITAGRKFQTKRNYNMECIECPTLKQALEFGLTEPIPKRKVKQRKQQTSDSSSSSRKKKTPTSPGSLNALELEDIIIDDEDDEDDYYY